MEPEFKDKPTDSKIDDISFDHMEIRAGLGVYF